MRGHVKAVGWLQILLGLVDLLLALALFGVLAGLGLLAGLGGGPLLPILGGTVGAVLGGLMALTAVPNLLAGFGLLAFKNWARLLALFLGALNVFKFPWGTAVALYTFWALLNDRARPLFHAGVHAGSPPR